MEIVVLSSDIARLVLDYLKSQNLKRATHTFCKTSPYLKQEFSAFKHGLQTHSFFPELEEIICEYVKITRKVDQQLPKLSNDVRFEFQQLKLSEKVSELLDRAVHKLTTNQEQASVIKGDSPDLHTSSSGPQTSNSINSDKENNNITKKSGDKKRKRTSDNSLEQSNIDELYADNKTKGGLSSYRSPKKRRVLEPYCFLSSKALQRHRRRNYFRFSSCTTTGKHGAENEEEVDDDDDEWSNTSTEDVSAETECEEPEGEDDGVGQCADGNGSELFDGEKPTKESTPRNKTQDKDNRRAPILPIQT